LLNTKLKHGVKNKMVIDKRKNILHRGFSSVFAKQIKTEGATIMVD